MYIIGSCYDAIRSSVDLQQGRRHPQHHDSLLDQHHAQITTSCTDRQQIGVRTPIVQATNWSALKYGKITSDKDLLTSPSIALTCSTRFQLKFGPTRALHKLPHKTREKMSRQGLRQNMSHTFVEGPFTDPNPNQLGSWHHRGCSALSFRNTITEPFQKHRISYEALMLQPRSRQDLNNLASISQQTRIWISDI